MNDKIIPAGMPIAVTIDIMMQSGVTIKKTKPIPKLFQMESEMVVAISSVVLGKK